MKKNILILALPFFLLGCKSDDIKSACSDTFCTEEFVTIAISIKDQTDSPVSLDYFEIVNINNNQDLTRDVSASELDIMRQNGIYPLFGDEHVNLHKNQELDIQFRGFIDNQLIINQNYIVGIDCCHVALISGSTELVIE